MRPALSPLAFAILSVISASISATTEIPVPEQTVEVPQLQPIKTQAEKGNTVGKTTYTEEEIKNTPNSSKNITDLLKVNPNVQFDRKQRSGRQQGELSPAEISINGSLPYENKFLINGLSINDNINPASSASSNSNTDLMGSSQTVAVNTDLLCNVTVLDSNVSAEYGEFTGGVVSAETCAPQTAVNQFHGSLSYDYTSDKWATQNYVSQEEESKYENSVSESYQKRYTKQGLSGTLYGNLTDRLGFNLAGSHRWSDIPLKTSLNDPTHAEQERQASNFALETFYALTDQTQLKFGMLLFEDSGDYFQDNVKNSATTHTSDSQAFYIQMKNELDAVKIEQQLNYQTQNRARDGQDHLYSWLRSESKNWINTGTLAQEGSFGQFEQEEQKLEYTLKTSFAPISFGKLQNTFKMGAGYGHYEAFNHRENDSYWYVSTTNLKGASCYSAEGIRYDACDEATTNAAKYDGQYAKTRTVYGAGDIAVRQDRWHAYLENRMDYDRYFSATLGLRADYDSLSKNNNFAPRSSFSYMPFGDSSLRFTTGWNRYYGLNAFANELQNRKRMLQSTQTRNSVIDAWTETAGSRYGAMQLSNQLDTPFSDETVFAINGQHANIDWSLKWVNRDTQDILRQTLYQTVPKPTGSGTYSIYELDNTGFSKSDIFTLSLKNIEALPFKNTLHHFSLGVDYTDTQRNFSSYNDRYEDPNSLIYYDGKIMQSGNRPADNFNQPWTVRTGWDIALTDLPVRISNFMTYKYHYDAMKLKANGYTDTDGNIYDSYTPVKNASTFAWDMRGTYTLPVSKNYSTVFGLTINNITNKNNEYIDSTGQINAEYGRQFIADVTFKF
ncbi:TonB-dependent receptor plug domain-containing protein [Acinetobacter sp. WCHAc010052]|uniref:TonB-dependent receptor plug domain-containing protein n=1 Tax=Acinetobacter sp. WCHAc010052 TaxID=2004647 RepID=UPI000B3BFE65|nr:TonB-dependent receptor [Acinetobacter sp. WCHAc010052]AXY59566.1 hypothetical protein CDG61_05700 [Acinetobacter sp. WCHAc010052]